MKELLEFIIKGIVGDKKFSVEEDSQGSHSNFLIHIDSASIGLIIGKSGKTIKAIRNILRVRATLENKGVSLDIAQEGAVT